MRAEVTGDARAQPWAHVDQAFIAGGVGGAAGHLAHLGLHEVLAGSLGDDDDGVTAALEAAAEDLQQTTVALQLERYLGDEHKIHIAHGQRGVAGDEAGVAAHQLHQPDAVGRAGRLDMRGARATW